MSKEGQEARTELPDLQAVLTDLQCLPAARELPSFLGFKRERSSGQLAATTKAIVADPTMLLLLEAAQQLKYIAAHRRFLRARRSGYGASDWDDSPPSEAEQDGACSGGKGGDVRSGPTCGCSWSGPASGSGLADPCAVCGSFGAADSVSIGSLSLGSSLARSASSGAVAAAAAAPKRTCLERSYAIDLDGYCSLIGQRLPLPEAEQA